MLQLPPCDNGHHATKNQRPHISNKTIFKIFSRRVFSKTYLKRTCFEADICLKRTKYFAPNISFLVKVSQTQPVQSGHLSKAEKNIGSQGVRFRQVSLYLQTFERLETSEDFVGLRIREWPGNNDFCESEIKDKKLEKFSTHKT